MKIFSSKYSYITAGLIAFGAACGAVPSFHQPGVVVDKSSCFSTLTDKCSLQIVAERHRADGTLLTWSATDYVLGRAPSLVQLEPGLAVSVTSSTAIAGGMAKIAGDLQEGDGPRQAMQLAENQPIRLTLKDGSEMILTLRAADQGRSFEGAGSSKWSVLGQSVWTVFMHWLCFLVAFALHEYIGPIPMPACVTRLGQAIRRKIKPGR